MNKIIYAKMLNYFVIVGTVILIVAAASLYYSVSKTTQITKKDQEKDAESNAVAAILENNKTLIGFIKGYEKEVLDMVNILSDKEDLLYSVTEAYSEGYDSEQLEVRLYASPDKRLEAAEKKIREYSEDLYRVLYDLVVP